jgi:hypothetical protein
MTIVNDRTDQVVFIADFEPAPEFRDSNPLLPLELRIHPRFPEAGRYTVQLWFFQETAPDILKMEQPLYVYQAEA